MVCKLSSVWFFGGVDEGGECVKVMDVWEEGEGILWWWWIVCEWIYGYVLKCWSGWEEEVGGFGCEV